MLAAHVAFAMRALILPWQGPLLYSNNIWHAYAHADDLVLACHVVLMVSRTSCVWDIQSDGVCLGGSQPWEF